METPVSLTTLFAYRVVDGRTSFDKVPAQLKPAVAEILIDQGLNGYVPDEYIPDGSGETTTKDEVN